MALSVICHTVCCIASYYKTQSPTIVNNVCTLWPGTSPGAWAQLVCDPGFVSLLLLGPAGTIGHALLMMMTPKEDRTFCIGTSQKCSVICVEVKYPNQIKMRKNNHRYLYSQTWKWRVHLGLLIYHCKTFRGSFIPKAREWDRNPFPLSVHLNGMSIAPTMKKKKRIIKIKSWVHKQPTQVAYSILPLQLPSG